LSEKIKIKKNMRATSIEGILIIIVLFAIFASVYPQREIDVSWDFNNPFDPSKSGWANASKALTDVDSRVESGELRLSITGWKPKLDSPSLFLNLTTRHFLIMRARYNGIATQAQWLLRSGATASSAEQLLVRTSSWSSRTPMKAISDSAHSFPGNSRSNLVDGDRYSSFVANTLPFEVVFDLSSFRWVNKLKITTNDRHLSPMNCLLLYSTTSGVGPFQNATSFTFSNSSFEQTVSGFQSFGRYWKLIVLDSYNSPKVAISEIDFEAYDESVTVLPFKLQTDNQYHTYYLPLYQNLIGNLLRLRMELLFLKSFDSSFVAAHGQSFHEDLAIDYIRIARAPEIWKVRGCLDKYYESGNYQSPQYNISNVKEMINDHLPIYSFHKYNLSLQFATTYDCPLEGGTLISIEGINFGNNPVVTVDGRTCQLITVSYSLVEGRIQELLCRLPPGTSGLKKVRVTNGIHPEMFYEVRSLAYRVAPPVLLLPNITNIAATKVDLAWKAPEDDFARMTITGYKIVWFQSLFPNFKSNLTVGNITTTSIRGLQPKTEYVFSIAALAEGYRNANLPTDLYGRRAPLSNALLGAFSDYTNVTGTLDYDFNFNLFNSNKTLNHSGSSIDVSDGPTGQFGSEGHYGLVIVGDANIQNCNVSSTCCDGYDPQLGIKSCGNYQSVCAVLAANMLAYSLVVDGVTRRGISSNLPYSNEAPPDISISTLDELIANKGADLPNIACGPALRLTPSKARTSGAAWYRRKVNVREGFDTSFKFEISSPSQKCDRLDDVNTFCRSRGADGFAFVIQNVYPDALGLQGSGLGYEGIFGALAVEFDTYHNFDQMDYYENHVSVLTQVMLFVILLFFLMYVSLGLPI
jgi:hypothetical protein